MTESKRTAEEHIHRWLESNGAALELRVARAFRQQAKTFHSYTFDSADGPREIDVYARFLRSDLGAPDRMLEVRVVVECKATKEPWVLYMAERPMLVEDDELLSAHLSSSDYLRDFGLSLSAAHRAPIFRPQMEAAYQLADTKSQDLAYKAIQQVTTASLHLYSDPPVDDHTTAARAIVVPAIVTTSPLWRVGIDGSGQIKAAQNSRTLLVAKRAGRPFPIWILNEDAVPAFVQDVRTSIGALDMAPIQGDPGIY